MTKSSMQRLQEKLAMHQRSLSQYPEDHPMRAYHQTKINETMERIQNLPNWIANSKSAPKVVRASKRKEECESDGKEQLGEDRNEAGKTFCNCGCKGYYEGETYCNVLRMNPGSGNVKQGCRTHISMQCRNKGKQCTDCARRALYSIPVPEQSVPAPAPAPQSDPDCKHDSRFGDSYSSFSSTRPRYHSRDQNDYSSREGSFRQSSLSTCPRSRSRDRREERRVPAPAPQSDPDCKHDSRFGDS
jgi:hypothetical protein